MSSPQVPASVAELKNAFIQSVEDSEKARILSRLARTPPATATDIQALFDLFMRFPDTLVRDSALSSLELMNRNSPHLEQIFVNFLQEPEPEAVLFGIKGALRIRDAKALPLIEKLARRKFAFKSPQDAPLLAERNQWWVQYEALSALAQWLGEEAGPLVLNKTRETPGVARILGTYFWKEYLPQFAKWSASGGRDNQERARQALTAPAPSEALRQTRPELLRILRDPKTERELRHQIALKVGLTSTEEEVSSLLQEYRDSKDPATRLMLSAALFASRSRQAIPLLLEHAKQHPDPRTRAGARLQLRDMLPKKEYRALLEWVSRNDPDPENREEAAGELKGP